MRKMDRSSELHSSAFSIRRLLNLTDVTSQGYDDQCDATNRGSGGSHRVGNGETFYENIQNGRRVAIAEVTGEGKECPRHRLTCGPATTDIVPGTIEYQRRIRYEAMPDSSSEHTR